MQPKRRSYIDPETGGKRRYRRYSVRFYDHAGIRRGPLALFAEKRASVAFCRSLERLIGARAGGEPLSREMIEWVGRMPRAQLDLLVSWKIVDARKVAIAIDVSVHIQAWCRYLAAEGVTTAHLKNTRSRINAILDGIRARRWSDVNTPDVAEWIAARTGPDGWSPATHRAYVQTARQFSRWLHEHEFDSIHRLVRLKGRGAGKGERRRDRRALSIEESRALICAAENSMEVVAGALPAVRALAYRLALHTGLRLSELLRLQVRWVHFGETAMIIPPANATKAGKKTGRVDQIIVRADLRAILEKVCLGRRPRALVLPGLRRDGGAAMLRHDLAHARVPGSVEAGIPYLDDAGCYADFHSLRHTFMTMTAATRPSMTDLVAIGRHTDPKVTERYLHAERQSRVDTLEKLPSLESTDPAEPSDPAPRSAQTVGIVAPLVAPPSAVSHERPRTKICAQDVKSAEYASQGNEDMSSKSVGSVFESPLPCHPAPWSLPDPRLGAPHACAFPSQLTLQEGPHDARRRPSDEWQRPAGRA